MLKMAPMSKASITPMPTAKPARATLSQRLGEVWSARAARARKSQPKLKGWDATPQQAVEKKSEFKAAAMPPRMQASGESLHCRKHSQALSPRNKSAKGAYIFEKMSLPKSMPSVAETFGDPLGAAFPIQFRSSHMPKKPDGYCPH